MLDVCHLLITADIFGSLGVVLHLLVFNKTLPYSISVHQLFHFAWFIFTFALVQFKALSWLCYFNKLVWGADNIHLPRFKCLIYVISSNVSLKLCFLIFHNSSDFFGRLVWNIVSEFFIKWFLWNICFLIFWILSDLCTR